MTLQFSSRVVVIVSLVLIVILVLAGALAVRSRPEAIVIDIHPARPTATPAPTATPKPILVYVTGEVMQPESTFTLPYGSRVSAAVEAAGGFTENANQRLVNPAGRLRDGDQIHVPALGDANDDLPTPSGGTRVYVNTATQAELESLPDIGAVTARRIIEYRELAGDFASLDDLDDVAGIGPSTLEKLKDLIAFD